MRCSDQERNGFLIDAAAERPDGQAVDVNPAMAIDPDAIRWYVLTEAGAALKAARLGRLKNERRGQS